MHCSTGSRRVDKNDGVMAGQPLHRTLEAMVGEYETEHPGALGSILLGIVLPRLEAMGLRERFGPE